MSPDEQISYAPIWNKRCNISRSYSLVWVSKERDKPYSLHYIPVREISRSLPFVNKKYDHESHNEFWKKLYEKRNSDENIENICPRYVEFLYRTCLRIYHLYQKDIRSLKCSFLDDVDMSSKKEEDVRWYEIIVGIECDDTGNFYSVAAKSRWKDLRNRSIFSKNFINIPKDILHPIRIIKIAIDPRLLKHVNE